MNDTLAPDTLVRARALALDAGTPSVGFDHPYYEVAWLPRIGPTSWLLWRTIGTRLAEHGRAAWTTTDLAHRHGVHLPALVRTLGRLAKFRIIRPAEPGELLVPAACIPLRPRQLRDADPETRRLHAETFPTRPA